MTRDKPPRVVIIGAGFGGLFAARTLSNEPVEVLLVDRNNFHTFTPLLYQVATCTLDPSEIAYPVRSIFRNTPNVRFLLGNAMGIDHKEKHVSIQSDGKLHRESYDYLIIAAGSEPTYFGSEEFKQHAFELRTLSDAVVLRNHILRCFEQAAWTPDHPDRKALTTIVIVGGGPTGLETAGAISELYNDVLDKEYAHEAKLKTHVVLVEMLPYLLAPYPPELRQSALEQLQSLGVEVILENPVEAVAPDHVRLKDRRCIPTHTLIWAAGAKASPVAELLGVGLSSGGRIPIKPTLEVAARKRVYAVGDIAYLEDAQGDLYPMLIPVAKQQGILAARNILRLIQGFAQQTFHYHDRGTMATIGRSRAVAWIYNWVPLRGFIAWVAWLGLHLVTLMGFRNQLNVLVNWAWNYLTFDRSVRIILECEQRGIIKEACKPASLKRVVKEPPTKRVDRIKKKG